MQKKPQRNNYRGFFHHEYEAWASRNPSHRNTTTQEDAYKVVKSPSVPNHSLDVRYWHLADIGGGAEHVGS